MVFLETELPGVIRVRPNIFGDARGFFLETYQAERFSQAGIDLPFVQDNLSRSSRNVVRGLHFQIQHPQGKLVSVLRGAIYDVAVDLRRSSPHFGQWTGATLSDESREALYIPPGFAHGFAVLSDSADVFYKCTDLYHPEHERTIAWNDPIIGIDWPLSAEPILSAKDQAGGSLQTVECYP
ncbi:MAG: dTDP-4-dehydrorhamnose 3,5-epimerase [Planctomycetaceae bacterium]|nr:dTDP-4-dehydrorhamnose 3,5-epimerase [Planctomycetaceae bacterium]